MKASKLTKETILDIGATDRGFPIIEPGDTVEVAQIITEGGKDRIQLFTGDVISFNKRGISSTFTVRRIGANNIGVEKIFPYYSPMISEIKVLKKGNVKRAKLFYVRGRTGKAARIKEKIESKQQESAATVNE